MVAYNKERDEYIDDLINIDNIGIQEMLNDFHNTAFSRYHHRKCQVNRGGHGSPQISFHDQTIIQIGANRVNDVFWNTVPRIIHAKTGIHRMRGRPASLYMTASFNLACQCKSSENG